MRRLKPMPRLLLMAVLPITLAILVIVLLLAPGDDSTEVEADAGPSTTAPSSAASTAAPSTAGAATPTAPTNTNAPATTNTAPPATAPPAPPAPPPFTSSIAPVTSPEQLYASWREGCPVHWEALRLVIVSHWGFDGGVRQGQLVVHQDAADATVGVMQSLYDQGYPIERMEPVDVYGGSDDASMDANNTSAFNCRPVTGGTSWSNHSYGTAIDVNPIQNPYVTRSGTVLPPAGGAYTNRGDVRQGMITAGDGVVAAFADIGWSWGGYWQNPIDYQHFEA